MSMITGCPACGTLFRVVSDQLRISDGWVRCGHCAEVFDATEHLQPSPALPAAPADAAGTERLQQEPQQPQASSIEPPSSARPKARPGPEPKTEPAPEGAPIPVGPMLTARVGEAHEAHGHDVEVIEVENPYSEFPSSMGPASVQPEDGERFAASDFQAGRDRPTLPPQPGEELESEVPASELAGESASGPELDEVSFVRQARRKAFWQRPLVRSLLLLLALALAALLAGQYAWRERDRLASTHPQLRPFLEQMCEALACRLGPPQRIEAILIDNSGFTRLRQDTYRLAFTLRNQSAEPVAVPALQLTLTDTQDQVVLQRVLTARELGAPADTLAANGDWSASVALAISGGQRVAGYRLLAFYP